MHTYVGHFPTIIPQCNLLLILTLSHVQNVIEIDYHLRKNRHALASESNKNENEKTNGIEQKQKSLHEVDEIIKITSQRQ